MSLTTTGSAANSYVTIDELDAYWSARNNSTWVALSGDAAKEAAAIEATQYIDAQFRERFVGYIRSTSQALEWPRNSAYDRSGRVLNAIPKAVKDACCELALASLDERLVPVLERGGKIARERVKAGPVESETEYMDGAPSGRTYTFAEKILAAVLKRSDGLART